MSEDVLEFKVRDDRATCCGYWVPGQDSCWCGMTYLITADRGNDPDVEKETK